MTARHIETSFDWHKTPRKAVDGYAISHNLVKRHIIKKRASRFVWVLTRPPHASAHAYVTPFDHTTDGGAGGGTYGSPPADSSTPSYRALKAAKNADATALATAAASIMLRDGGGGVDGTPMDVGDRPAAVGLGLGAPETTAGRWEACSTRRR